MPLTRDDFTPEVGGFLDNTAGVIIAAEFTTASEDYLKKMTSPGGSPNIGITLTVECPGLEKPVTQWWSVGSGDIWQISNGGKEIVNTKDPDSHKFRKGSKAWALIEAMLTAVGGGDVGKGQDFFIARGATMTQVGFYTGLEFFWKRKPIDTVGGEKSDTPLPEKFIGEKTVAGSSTSAEADTSELDLIVAEISTGLDERSLKSAAIKRPELKKNPTYLKSLVSGTLLKTLEDSGVLTRGPDGKFV